MRKRIINIIEFGRGDSKRIVGILEEKLNAAGFSPVRDSIDGAELIIVIGGDGSFLRTLQKYDFPPIPFVGINTGHLGFFQELYEDDLDWFIKKYLEENYKKQCYRTISGSVEHEEGSFEFRALNEISVKSADARLAQMDIYLGDNLIEKFYGDGVVIATPAGSTSYNYALGGVIVDPGIDLIQLTPIAPIHTTAYRSFTSGIVLPPGLPVMISPDPDFVSEGSESGRRMMIAIDGNYGHFPGVKSIEAVLSEQNVNLLRFKDYVFWTTVKQKLLTP